MYNVIIVGSGPAGISAGLYLKRANLNILIISKNDSALNKTEKIENYYGLQSISGKELYENGIKQAKNMNIPIVNDEVIDINLNYENNKFIISTVNNVYDSEKVILATGTNRLAPKIKGLKEFEGKGISYCAICDAYFYKNKNIAVLGNGNYAIHEAKILKPIAKTVTILTNGEEIIQNRDSATFDVENSKIREFRGDNVINEIEFENNKKQNIDGVFIALGTASSVDLAKKIGALVKNNNIVVNENMETSIKGLYACGDCTGGILQINKAVYEGAKSALSIISKKE